MKPSDVKKVKRAAKNKHDPKSATVNQAGEEIPLPEAIGNFGAAIGYLNMQASLLNEALDKLFDKLHDFPDEVKCAEEGKRKIWKAAGRAKHGQQVLVRIKTKDEREYIYAVCKYDAEKKHFDESVCGWAYEAEEKPEWTEIPE